MAASTSSSYLDTISFRKRSNPGGSDNDREGPQAKSSRESVTYYYVLAPESEPPTDEDTESIHSVQEKPTDSAKDTSDTSISDDDENVVYTIGDDGVFRRTTSFLEEYEPASLSEHEPLLPDVLSSASNSDSGKGRKTLDFEFVISVTDAQDEATWADTSSVSSDDDPACIDPELSLRDYWSCVQCKATNNNPLFRYCEKCFKVRKNFFPPRPKGKKKKKPKKTRSRRNKRSTSDSNKPSTSGETVYSRESCSFKSDTSTKDKTDCFSLPSSDLRDDCFKGNNQSSESDISVASSVSVKDSNSETITEPKLSCDNLNNNSSVSSSLCETCMSRPKDGVFVHGRKFGHMYCCYQCSKKVWRNTGRCPLCNCKVMQVLRVISS